MKLLDILPKFGKASTRKFFEEGSRTPGYTWKDALHGYIYARWPYQYIAIGVGEHPLSRALGPLVAWISARLPQKAEKMNGDGVPLEYKGYARQGLCQGMGYAGAKGTPRAMPTAITAKSCLSPRPPGWCRSTSRCACRTWKRSSLTSAPAT